MRKLSFIMILLFCATFTYAQKGKVTQAISYLTSGKLDQAKKLIDEAMGHESCVAWDKAYFTKGQIYQALYESPVADYKKLDSEAVEKAWEAYQKVIELDVKKKYPKKLETQYRNLAIDFTNRAAELYNAKDFKKALASFKRVLEIKSSPILTANGEVPISQITDRYEQIEQKFLDGKYGSIFMYSGAINTFECAGAYRMEKIQVAPLPGFRNNATNIATWQYVLNKASEHEKAAIKFLKYAASREGNIAYAECMKRLPARLDVIREEKLDIPGFQVFQDYVNHVELKERPFSSNPMKDISKTGILFQQYVMDQISQDEFCEKMEEMQKNQR